jgi:broad specificity phosphatase PhoE
MGKVQKQVLRLFLIRHGETADNAQMRYLGTRDEPLTDKGIRQARQVANALSQFPIKAIFASPLRRAADTAIQIQKACEVDLRSDSRLMEGSFGRWEGLTRAEVMRLGGRDARQLARWESNPACAPPGGESIKKLQKRMISLVYELKAEYEGSSVVLVSHVGPIKALLAAALEVPLQVSRRLFLDPCSISVVDWGSPPFLRLFNSHAHLGWATPRWMTPPNSRTGS